MIFLKNKNYEIQSWSKSNNGILQSSGNGEHYHGLGFKTFEEWIKTSRIAKDGRTYILFEKLEDGELSEVAKITKEFSSNQDTLYQEVETEIQEKEIRIDELEDENNDLQEEIEGQQSRYEETMMNYQNIKNDYNKLDGTLKGLGRIEAESNRKLEDAAFKYRSLEERYDNLREENDKLREENRTLMAENQKMNGSIVEQARVLAEETTKSYRETISELRSDKDYHKEQLQLLNTQIGDYRTDNLDLKNQLTLEKQNSISQKEIQELKHSKNDLKKERDNKSGLSGLFENVDGNQLINALPSLIDSATRLFTQTKQQPLTQPILMQPIAPVQQVVPPTMGADPKFVNDENLIEYRELIELILTQPEENGKSFPKVEADLVAILAKNGMGEGTKFQIKEVIEMTQTGDTAYWQNRLTELRKTAETTEQTEQTDENIENNNGEDDG